ncbi:MAG TPA: glycosyltransferase family 39 protein [Verrucomicrobiae bacterium]|nr:glycosyltransferase family 39 protein [Verrucomicrobiae bacterium]
MNRIDKFRRQDWILTLFFFTMSLALRIPFRSQMAYHWDSAQFSLAVNQYDIRLSQPHAPGYFLYVMFGRLVNCFVGDPHASLVWISIVFGSALPSILYLLGTSMFGRRAGAITVLVTMTSPQTWFHSCVALTYIVDSFLVCAMVFVLWEGTQNGGTFWVAVLTGTILALIGGVRQQSVPGLLPLIVFAFWRFRRARAAKLTLAATVATGFGIAWFLPMIRLSGGIGTYLEIIRRHAAFNAPATFLGGGWRALFDNVARVAGFCWNGLALAAAVLIAALFHRAFRMSEQRKRQWDGRHSTALKFLAFWIVPMMLLGTVIGFTKQPGYVLSYLPGWFVLIGALVAALGRRSYRTITTCTICITNIFVFVAWPAQWDQVFFGVGRTAREIREHDRRLSQTVATIRRLFKPNDVIVCHADEFYLYGLRHFQLYLPEYDNYQLAIDSTTIHPKGRPMWRARGGCLQYVAGLDLEKKKGIILVVPPKEDVGIFKQYVSLANITCLTNREPALYFLPVARRMGGREVLHTNSGREPVSRP